MKQKALQKFTFVSGGTKWCFWKDSKQTNISHGTNRVAEEDINIDPIAANSSLCCNLRYHDLAVNWLAHLESSLRKSGGWSGPNSELHSSLHYNLQYHGQVPLDGRYRKGQVYTMLAILLVPEEAPWSGLDSFRATVEAKPHISRELG